MSFVYSPGFQSRSKAPILLPVVAAVLLVNLWSQEIRHSEVFNSPSGKAKIVKEHDKFGGLKEMRVIWVTGVGLSSQEIWRPQSDDQTNQIEIESVAWSHDESAFSIGESWGTKGSGLRIWKRIQLNAFEKIKWAKPQILLPDGHVWKGEEISHRWLPNGKLEVSETVVSEKTNPDKRIVDYRWTSCYRVVVWPLKKDADVVDLIFSGPIEIEPNKPK